MRATTRLLTSAPRRMRVAFVLLLLIDLGGLVGAVALQHAAVLVASGSAVMFWSWLRAMDLYDLMQPESLLLPGFRRFLLRAGLIETALLLLPPTLVAWWLNGPGSAWLTLALLALVAALGLSSGAGRRWWRLLMWAALLGFGRIPKPLLAAIFSSTYAPLLALAVLLALLLVLLVLRPLLRVDDAPRPISPLAATAMRPGDRIGARTPGRGGAVVRRLNALFNMLAERELQEALARYRRRPTAWRRRSLLRAMLLPHDGPVTLLAQLALTLLILGGYLFLTHAQNRWHASYVGFYAILLGCGRLQRLGRGLPRFRPQLAELYLTTAPATRRDFQALVADSLLWLVGVAVFSSLVYAVAVAVLLHAHDTVRLLACVGVGAIGAALAQLGVFLVGPEKRGGQTGVYLVHMLVFGGVYAGIYWLCGVLGTPLGAALGLLVSLAFGVGTWQSARRQFLARAPRFDAPAAR